MSVPVKADAPEIMVPHPHQLVAREAILAAAERLFLRQGFAATRIEAICRAAEISLGTFYNFFRSKQDLLIFFLSRDRERVSERIAQALAAPTDDPAGYLRGLLLADLSLDAPDFSRDLWREILAAMLLGLCTTAARQAAAESPVQADLTGGLADAELDMAALAATARERMAAPAADAGPGGASRQQLAALGETRNPSVADLFVATMKGTYA